MIKKYLPSLLFILLLKFSSSGYCASPQIPDYIVFKGDTIVTYNLILEQYLQSHLASESGKLFGLSFREGASTNCWRGYQAIYKIDRDSLFLIDIIDCGERKRGIDKTASVKRMKAIFRDQLVTDRIYISWFSGDINFPLTNKVLRWDGVFYTIYEKETVINIFNGKVLKVENVENYIDDPKGINRKDKKKVSDILFNELEKVKWKNIDKVDCSEKYFVTINEKGRVSKVTMPEYPGDSIDEYWERSEYNYCVNTILNAFKKLKFDIIKNKGIPISENIYIEIWFDEKTGKLENWTHH